jgi:hypothetical protein
VDDPRYLARMLAATASARIAQPMRKKSLAVIGIHASSRLIREGRGDRVRGLASPDQTVQEEAM